MCNNFAITVQKKVHSFPVQYRQVGVDLRNRFTFLDNGLVCKNRGGITENSSTCSIVNVNLDNINYLMHVAPEKYKDNTGYLNLNNILKNLDNIMETLYETVGKTKSEPSAVITGGRWINDKDAKSLLSMDFMNCIALFFERRGIPLSIIFGKKTPKTFDNAYIYNKYMTIWNDSLKGKKLQENPTKEQIEDAIKENYEVVEIAPEHNINFVID